MRILCCVSGYNIPAIYFGCAHKISFYISKRGLKQG